MALDDREILKAKILIKDDDKDVIVKTLFIENEDNRLDVEIIHDMWKYFRVCEQESSIFRSSITFKYDNIDYSNDCNYECSIKPIFIELLSMDRCTLVFTNATDRCLTINKREDSFINCIYDLTDEETRLNEFFRSSNEDFKIISKDLNYNGSL